MQGIKDWVRGIAVLTVFAGAVDMVLPEGDLRKYARAALGMLIVLCVVAPLARMISGGPPVEDLYFPAPASASSLDDRTARALEWQAEALARAVPGVNGAKATVKMKDSVGWPLPRGPAGVESVTVRVSAGAPSGDVEAVTPVGGDAGQPPGGSGSGELAEMVREVISARFGIAPEAVTVDLAG